MTDKEIRTLKSRKFGGEYIFGETLGEGAQATVYKFTKSSGEVYATKMTPIDSYLHTPDEEKNQKRWKAIVRELCILESLDSINVIKPIEFIRTSNNLYLVQEYANGGSLQNLLDKRKKFHESEAKLLLLQIIAGFKHLYEHQVVHRDLKLDNLLIHFPN